MPPLHGGHHHCMVVTTIAWWSDSRTDYYTKLSSLELTLLVSGNYWQPPPLNLPHANLRIPYTDLKINTYKYIMSNWQEEWNNVGTNKTLFCEASFVRLAVLLLTVKTGSDYSVIPILVTHSDA